MQRAGRAAFAELLQRWPGVKSISVVCGKGNNAGDGYIVAGLALELGLHVQIIQVGDPGDLQGDAGRARDWAYEKGLGTVHGPDAPLEGQVIVDALLGTGFAGALRPQFAQLAQRINDGGADCGVLALDIPTGVLADTGVSVPGAVRADVTVTFIGRKAGLFTGPGVSLAGDVVYASLGLPDDVLRDVAGCPLLRMDEQPSLPGYDRNAYKQLQGHVAVVGGDRGMGGAPLMAGEAALRMGAGLVTVITRAEHRAAILSRRPEIMVVDADDAARRAEALDRASVLVLGPGLGRGAWGSALLAESLALGKPAVLDADGLHAFAALQAVPAAPLIATPHPGEAAAVLGSDSGSVQADRFEAAREVAARVGGVAVLKGAGSVVAEADGVCGVCAHGNPGMASAGMGDVLSGVIGGLLAQRLSPVRAAVFGTCLHSAAADAAAGQVGQRSLVATDLLPAMIDILRSAQ